MKNILSAVVVVSMISCGGSSTTSSTKEQAGESEESSQTLTQLETVRPEKWYSHPMHKLLQEEKQLGSQLEALSKSIAEQYKLVSVAIRKTPIEGSSASHIVRHQLKVTLMFREIGDGAPVAESWFKKLEATGTYNFLHAPNGNTSENIFLEGLSVQVFRLPI